MWVDLICLANSSKLGGRCVAGVRAGGGGWVRLIAPDTDHGQLYRRHLRLDDDSDPGILDLIAVDLARPAPVEGQPENWEIARRPWKLRQRPARTETTKVLRKEVVRGPELLGSRGSRMPKRQAAGAGSSLALIVPERVRWFLQRDAAERTHVRAMFELGGQLYDLPLTDPAWTSRAVRSLSRLRPGRHPSAAIGIPDRNHVLFTVSLSEPYHGYCYKLIAGLVTFPRRTA